MSYCRLSSICENNFESDLYIFDHVDGYISVHIAHSRLDGIEQAPRLIDDTDKQWIESFTARQLWKEQNEDKLFHKKIDLPYAGGSFSFTTAVECVKFLNELKTLGYNMPARVLNLETFKD